MLVIPTTLIVGNQDPPLLDSNQPDSLWNMQQDSRNLLRHVSSALWQDGGTFACDWPSLAIRRDVRYSLSIDSKCPDSDSGSVLYMGPSTGSGGEYLAVLFTADDDVNTDL